MRAYIAVLKDSLREAMASRVLWVALIAIAIVLLALAPFAMRTDSATRLRPREVVDSRQVVDLLEADKSRDDTPAGHIWSLLNDDQRSEISKLLTADAGTSRRGSRRGSSASRLIVRTFNDLVKRDDFYNEKSWANVELDEDTRALLGSSATGDQLASRNLKLLVAAFPSAIRVRDSNQISLTYAGRNVVGPLPLAPPDLEPVVERVLVYVVSGFLGFLGVFASLLVTAAVIPRTFEPGEIALLLSKPVNRSFLFLTKFFGGCVFTLLCGTALVGGVWLLLGTRLGIWEHKLLLCIPVYVFLFSVYYAVSATAGLVWRNAVVALVLVVVFWLILFIVGVVKAALDQNVFKPASITEIVPDGDRLFAVNGSRQLLLYNSATREWEQKLRQDGRQMPAMVQRLRAAGTRFKPTPDPANQRVLAIESISTPFGKTGRLVIGREGNDYERQTEGETPGASSEVFVDSAGRVIVPTSSGVYEFVGQSETERKTTEFLGKYLGGLIDTSSKKAFQPIHDKELKNWDSDFQTAMHPTDDTLFVYSNGEILRLPKQDDGTYALGATRDLDSEEDAVLSVGGSHLTIALGDGSIHVVDADTLEDVHTDQFEEGTLPRVCLTATDGSVSAILTHDGNLWMFDCAAGKPTSWRPPEDGSVSAIAFGSEGRMFVAAGRQTIKTYQFGSVVDEYRVDGDWVTRLYDWVINPIYTVLPKPGEVDNFVYYLLTGSKSQSLVNSMPGARANLEEDRVTFDIWRPLWSNLVFVVAMLAFACFYVSRRDF